MGSSQILGSGRYNPPDAITSSAQGDRVYAQMKADHFWTDYIQLAERIGTSVSIVQENTANSLTLNVLQELGAQPKAGMTIADVNIQV